MDHAVVHVVAGVLRDSAGRILLTQRPPGKHLAGLWEFPGGKCEPGEAPVAALRRELGEEVGIEIGAAEKLIAVPWRYAEKSICLDVYNVRDYAGSAHGREGQALQWVDQQALRGIEMPPADRPIVMALQLPRHCVITAEPDTDVALFLRRLERALAAGSCFIQLRSKHLPVEAMRPIVARARAIVRAAGARLLLNDHVALAQEFALDGVHLSARELMRRTARPLPDEFLVGASCHDERELAHAESIGVDFAVLGPVTATASHPGHAALGWQRFAQLCAACAMPVFALGGMRREDLRTAIDCGAQGIAGISAFWPPQP